MATLAEPLAAARADINRENAQLSTGPTSAAGKQRVAHNATKHGIFARTVVLPHEAREAYEELGAALHERYQPQSDTARELVQTLQDARWRLQRLIALDYNVIALATEQQFAQIDEQFETEDPGVRLAFAQGAAYQANARLLDQISRHENRLQRLCERTAKSLEEIAAARPRLVPQPPAPATPPANGFVPSISKPASPKPEIPHFTGPMADIKRKQWLRKNGF